MSRLKVLERFPYRFVVLSRELKCFGDQVVVDKQKVSCQNKKLNFKQNVHKKFFRPTFLAVKHFSTYVTNVPNVSMSHVKRILNSKKMEHKEGFTCLTTKCVFCQQSSNVEENLFINKVTGQ